MKTFQGTRKYTERNIVANQLGWILYDENHMQRMRKEFEDIGMIDVCIRSLGRFFAYNSNGDCIGAEYSESLDGTYWYDEILKIISFDNKEGQDV